MDLRVTEDPAATAGRWLARRLRDAVRRRGQAAIAVSGGTSAPPMFDMLLAQDVPWSQVTMWQVDERVAPDGHPERNAGQLAGVPCRVVLMPVTDDDLGAAASRYAGGLPERFDVVHLGLGDDGHTASWPPGDAVVDSAARCEAIGEFNGFRRMTLTPLVVNAARSRLVLVSGESKASMVRRWLLGDPSIPVTRLRRTGTWAMLDPAAASELPEPSAR
jgi:6-phosphogluconolactonase/glucosamine-6-phosphate isomerase/deaminase